MPVSSQSPTCGAPYSYSLFNTYQGALTVEAPTGGSDGKIKLDTSLILPSGYNVEYTNFLEVRYQVYGNQLPPASFEFKAIIYDCVDTNISLFSLDLAAQTFYVTNPVESFAIPDPTYLNPNFDCGPIEYFIEENRPFISLVQDIANNDW